MEAIPCILMAGAVPALFMLVWIVKFFFIVQPRQQHILLHWGRYTRTVSEPGIRFAFPIGLQRIPVSTRDVAFTLPVTTVVERSGNPIQVSCVVVYRIVDAQRAVLDVQQYHQFISSQASTVLKTVCARYPYEARVANEPSLKHESDEILRALTDELGRLVHNAGLEVSLVRLNDLTYAPEIAQSMLLRQQAQAMVDARRTLVEGAVETVRDALQRLDQSGMTLSPDVRARLATNLTLLLCAGERGEQHSTVVTRQR